MPDEIPRTADVVVVGGGVMGTSAAYHLARKGVRDVLLLEREPFLGAMSTGQCAGGIRHQFASEINVRLSIESIRMLERFADELGQEIGLRFIGYLMVLTSSEDAPAFRASLDLQHRLGVLTKWLKPDDVAPLVPFIDLEGVIGATFYERDGLCDPSSVVQGYAVGGRALGVRVLTGAEVVRIQTDGGRIRSVETRGGIVHTPVVVDACGAWAAGLGRMIGVDVPIQPIRRQMLVTTELPEVAKDFPFTVFFREALYFHPEGEGVLTGKSNPGERPGYSMEVDPEWEMVHLEEAVRRMPVLGEAGVRARWAGLYEVTPDAHPVIGRVPPVEGFHVMAGFSGHGFMHGPIAGLLMAEEIVDGRAHTVDIDPFRYDRFLTGELAPEYNVI
jgi:sarcosine oxidase subunit beta